MTKAHQVVGGVRTPQVRGGAGAQGRDRPVGNEIRGDGDEARLRRKRGPPGELREIVSRGVEIPHDRVPSLGGEGRLHAREQRDVVEADRIGRKTLAQLFELPSLRHDKQHPPGRAIRRAGEQEPSPLD